MERSSSSPQGQVPVQQCLAAFVVSEEVGGVDDRHHRVQTGDFLQGAARPVREGKGLRDRQRFAHPRALDEQIVKASVSRQLANFQQQVLAQRAADAAVAHLHELFLRAGKRRAAVAHQHGVDVDLAHVVDDDRYTPPLAVVKHMVKQGGLARAQEAGEHGDGQFAGGQGMRR